MSHFKTVTVWFGRLRRYEDPLIRRMEKLGNDLDSKPKVAIPLFFARKTLRA